MSRLQEFSHAVAGAHACGRSSGEKRQRRAGKYCSTGSNARAALMQVAVVNPLFAALQARGALLLSSAIHSPGPGVSFTHSANCFGSLTLFQGDFARILMEMLGEELSKPAHAAMRHNITGIVEAALRTSASAGEDTMYDRIDCWQLLFHVFFAATVIACMLL